MTSRLTNEGEIQFTHGALNVSTPIGATNLSTGDLTMKVLATLLLLSSIALGASSNQTATQPVTIQVKTVTALAIASPASVPNVIIVNGVVQPYAGATFTVSGGTAPYTWSVSTGALPAGLTLTTGGTNGVNGVVGGTPLATATTQTFTIQVTDSTSTVAQIDLNWTAPAPNPPAEAAANFKVYRGTTHGGPYPVVVGQVAAAVTSLSDVLTNFVHGSSVFYVATSVGSDLQESIFSNELALVLP